MNSDHNHVWFQTGMLLSHSTGRAYYWRQCDICGFKEYRDQNEPVADEHQPKGMEMNTGEFQ